MTEHQVTTSPLREPLLKVRKVDFSPDEFIAGTVGMTPEEVGVYWLVCSLIYSSGGAIPEDDERLRALRCNPRTTRAIIANLVAKGKIEVGSDCQMIVKRCRRELESAANRMRKSAEAGSKGGRPAKTAEEHQAVAEPEAFSSEKPSPSPSPSSISISRDSARDLRVVDFPGAQQDTGRRRRKNQDAEPPGFAAFYDAMPLKRDPDDAAKAFRKVIDAGKATPEQLLAGARAYAAERMGQDPKFTKHPATWLNKGSWKDQPSVYPTSAKGAYVP